MRPELVKLFGEGCSRGKPAGAARRRAGAQPPELRPSAPPAVDHKPEPGVRWTYGRFLEAAEGGVYHALLERLRPFGADLRAKLEAARAELAAAGTQAAPEALARLEDFLSLPEAAEWFAPKPGRVMKAEAEFVDEEGALFRLDRVIIDPDGVTVADFKTGAEDTEKYSAQLRKYAAIAGQVYGRPVRCLLGYIDLRKVVAVK
jgi:ATP-dependent exoDNAse (exonuclease V) beta subunit